MSSKSAAPSHLADQSSQAYPLLDLLRFGAALVVMLSHLRDVFFAPFTETAAASTAVKAVFFAATRTGQEAVMLFFVISGFLVGGGCIRQLRRGSFSARRYAIDRITRIYVPLLPTLAVTFLAVAVFEGRHDVPTLIVNVLSLQGVFGPPIEGDGALWSLSYEVWFYVIAGAVCIMATARSAKAATLAFLATAASLLVFSRLVPQYMFVWIFGALAFCLPRPRSLWPTLALALPITAAGVFLMQVTIDSEQIDLTRMALVGPMTAVLICGFGFALLVHAASYADADAALVRRTARPADALAAFSYTLYLLHLPIELVLRHLGLLNRHASLDAGSFALYLATAGGILALCYGFYWLAERHTGAIRRVLYEWAGVAKRRARPLVAGPAQASSSTSQ